MVNIKWQQQLWKFVQTIDKQHSNLSSDIDPLLECGDHWCQVRVDTGRSCLWLLWPGVTRCSYGWPIIPTVSTLVSIVVSAAPDNEWDTGVNHDQSMIHHTASHLRVYQTVSWSVLLRTMLSDTWEPVTSIMGGLFSKGKERRSQEVWRQESVFENRLYHDQQRADTWGGVTSYNLLDLHQVRTIIININIKTLRDKLQYTWEGESYPWDCETQIKQWKHGKIILWL